MHLERLKGQRLGLPNYTYLDRDHQGQVCPNMVKNTEDTHWQTYHNIPDWPSTSLRSLRFLSEKDSGFSYQVYCF